MDHCRISGACVGGGSMTTRWCARSCDVSSAPDAAC
jgi:hypothetical protein